MFLSGVKVDEHVSFATPVIVSLSTSFLLLVVFFGLCIYRKRKMSGMEDALNNVELDNFAKLSTRPVRQNTKTMIDTIIRHLYNA